MTMKASNRQVGGVTVVDLSGRITLGEGSVVLRDSVRDLVAKGQTKILLNLGDVTYIDSSGIGELVSAFTTVRNQGGDLKLLKLTKKVHDLSPNNSSRRRSSACFVSSCLESHAWIGRKCRMKWPISMTTS